MLYVTETKEPEERLAYAQDWKVADSRYSVATFRRDIVLSRFHEAVISAKEMQEPEVELPDMRRSWACPWVRLYCTQSGLTVPFRQCTGCDFVDERR